MGLDDTDPFTPMTLLALYRLWKEFAAVVYKNYRCLGHILLAQRWLLSTICPSRVMGILALELNGCQHLHVNIHIMHIRQKTGDSLREITDAKGTLKRNDVLYERFRRANSTLRVEEMSRGQDFSPCLSLSFSCPR